MSQQAAGVLVSIFPFILLIAVFYFMIIMPQRKREKKVKQMLADLKVGDLVTSVGGIYGRVVNIKDDIVTIEVGVDKVKITLARWAIRNVGESDVVNDMK